MPFNRYLNNFKYKNVVKIPARMQKIPSRPAVSASIVGSSSVPIPRKSYVRSRNTCLPEI